MKTDASRRAGYRLAVIYRQPRCTWANSPSTGTTTAAGKGRGEKNRPQSAGERKAEGEVPRRDANAFRQQQQQHAAWVAAPLPQVAVSPLVEGQVGMGGLPSGAIRLLWAKAHAGRTTQAFQH